MGLCKQQKLKMRATFLVMCAMIVVSMSLPTNSDMQPAEDLPVEVAEEAVKVEDAVEEEDDDAEEDEDDDDEDEEDEDEDDEEDEDEDDEEEEDKPAEETPVETIA